MPTRSRKPADLGASGARLWRDISGKYELRPDELRILEDACREADLVDELREAMDGANLTTSGSMGQTVVNPLIPELRQHRTTFSALIRQLKLPDDDPDAGRADRSVAARSAAQARWARRGA